MIITTKSGKKFNNSGNLPIGHCPHCGYQINAGCFYNSGYWECSECGEVGEDTELHELSESEIEFVKQFSYDSFENANFHIENNKYVMNE